MVNIPLATDYQGYATYLQEIMWNTIVQLESTKVATTPRRR